jgi:hypothetical protein
MELKGRRKLIASALAGARDDRLRDTLEGSIGDAQAFCWGALRQFDRKHLASEPELRATTAFNSLTVICCFLLLRRQSTM